jgi:coenzyme F420-reducing hydrogenase alpha subunit
MKRLVIDPVSRIEGHGKVVIDVDDAGEVLSARFRILEFRGFEKFCEGRPVWELPLLVTKICGICPVPHHLASVKAAEAALGVGDIPPAAVLLRRLLQAGGDLADHALHFFYLALPDFLLGETVAPRDRSIIEVARRDPALAERAIALRKAGIDIAEAVGGHAVYPVTAIPGGMSKGLSAEDRGRLRSAVEAVLPTAETAVEMAFSLVGRRAAAEALSQETVFMAMIGPDGGPDHYRGLIRMTSADGTLLEEFPPEKYLHQIAEYVEDDTWCKFPYYRKMGVRDGNYRVGPLARLNIAASLPHPRSAARLAAYRELTGGRPHLNVHHYHLARAIELLAACEEALALLDDPGIVSADYRIPATRRAGEGVGAVEAPRGTLIHHYTCDDNGFVTSVNLIVPTTHNNLSINRAAESAARLYLKNGVLDDAASLGIETAIRAFDPCLSCSTHEAGRPAFTIEVRRPHG